MAAQSIPAAPTFSVLIPTRDRAAVLRRCLDAVLAQTHPAAEVIVINDGSLDDTSEMLASEEYAPRCIVVDGGGSGVATARNMGIERATADWIVFIDDDDLPSPRWLETLARLATDDVGIVSAAAEIVSLDGRRVRVPEPVPEGATVLFLPGTFAARRNLLIEVGGYLDGLTFSENSELRMRLVPACHRSGLRIAYTEEPLVEIFHDGPRRSTRGRRKALLMFLQAHEDRFRAEPTRMARLLCIAGVDSWRDGDRAMARRLFWRAARAHPTSMHTLGRLAASLVPPVGNRVWGRSTGSSGSDE